MSQAELSGITAYCMFVGYPRSGHSLIGSLLDAHPNIIIAHELDALKHVQARCTREQLFGLLIENSRSFTAAGRSWNGYEYAVANQWQGRYRELHVIGDKKGGLSSVHLRRNPQLLERLSETARVPVKYIHVVRNPWDNIATLSRNEGGSLPGAAQMYFGMARSVADLKNRVPATDMQDLRHEDFIADPKQHLAALCRFLGEEATDDYLADCAAIVHPAAHQSRASVEWPPALMAQVQEQARQFPFLAGYAFESK